MNKMKSGQMEKMNNIIHDDMNNIGFIETMNGNINFK